MVHDDTAPLPSPFPLPFSIPLSPRPYIPQLELTKSASTKTTNPNYPQKIHQSQTRAQK